MIERKVVVPIKLTPNELASEFCNMSADGQAMFFNEVGYLIENWDRPFCFQLESIRNEPLTEQGRYVMQSIGEYSESE